MAGKRQLAAILCTDIDAYADLIQQDESLASKFKERHREVLHLLAEKYHGRILQNIGHDSLSLFSSAVEAVQCAIEMQLAFRENISVPVKIGIHLGDIIFMDEEVIGDGLNIARKIETQSVPGGILISNKIYQEVKNHSGIECRYIKTCDLDEQGQQVMIFAITNEGIEAPEGSRDGRQPGTNEPSSGSGLRYFWEEAKRRNVVRVVSIYAAAAYVILEISSIISDSLNLPEWTMVVIIALLVVIFIVLTIISWIYDITPEGIKKTLPAGEISLAEPMPPPVSTGNWFIRNKIFRRYLLPLIILVLLVGFYFFKERIFQNWERVNKAAKEHTEIAILYLNNNADPALIKGELDLALEADPEYSVALYNYALVHRMEGDTLFSKQKLHAVVESDPGYSNAWDLLANYAFNQDSFDLAMGYSIQAIESDPGNYIAAYNMAIQSEDRGYVDQAITFFRKAYQMDSTFVRAYSALGALFNKENRPTEAILTLRESLRISPSSIYNYLVYKNLAEAHFLLNEYDKALEYLEQSKALNADFPETEKCFARYYEAIGENESSILHWRRYLTLETDTVELLISQQRLDSLRTIASQ